MKSIPILKNVSHICCYGEPVFISNPGPLIISFLQVASITELSLSNSLTDTGKSRVGYRKSRVSADFRQSFVNDHRRKREKNKNKIFTISPSQIGVSRGVQLYPILYPDLQYSS